MSLGHGASIVRDGLVLHLDAAGAKSYPGSGTTWTDLSGNGNDGTLVNGVGYSSDNNGSLDFDGSNDYVNTGLGNYSDDEISLSAWFNTSITSGTRTIIGRGGINTLNEIDLIFGYADPFRLVARFAGPSNQILYTWPIENANKWKNAVMTIKNNGATRTNTLYIDGVSVGSTTSSNIISSYSENFYVGRIEDGRYFSGNISQVSIYNRALTADEIKKNFEATRGRYGI